MHIDQQIPGFSCIIQRDFWSLFQVKWLTSWLWLSTEPDRLWSPRSWLKLSLVLPLYKDNRSLGLIIFELSLSSAPRKVNNKGVKSGHYYTIGHNRLHHWPNVVVLGNESMEHFSMYEHCCPDFNPSIWWGNLECEACMYKMHVNTIVMIW